MEQFTLEKTFIKNSKISNTLIKYDSLSPNIDFFRLFFVLYMIFSTAPRQLQDTVLQYMKHDQHEARTRVLNLELSMHAAERKTVYKRRLF